MKKSFAYRWLIVACAAVYSCLFFMAALVLAQETGNGLKSDGQGFQISPALVELDIDPGKSYELKINIKNVTSGPLIAKAQVNDFGAKGENGDPQIFLDDEENRTYSLKNWVGKVNNERFEPKETKAVTVKITAPEDAEPGGHYGVIRFTGVAPELEGDESAVALSASIGTLVLVRVSGDVKESARVEEFFASQNGKKSSFFETGPIKLTERIKNTGNVHIKPTGEAVVKDVFGKTVASLKVNNPPKNILPDSIRRFEQELNKKWLFGRYTASLTLVYGTSNQNMSSELVFWVIPWKLIAAIILLIIVLVLVLRTSLKRYNRYIVEKAQNGKTKPPKS